MKRNGLVRVFGAAAPLLLALGMRGSSLAAQQTGPIRTATLRATVSIQPSLSPTLPDAGELAIGAKVSPDVDGTAPAREFAGTLAWARGTADSPAVLLPPETDPGSGSTRPLARVIERHGQLLRYTVAVLY